MSPPGRDTPLRLAPTKIRPPSLDDRLTRRDRLDDLLTRAARITLIVAPAGYGKTVSAAHWALARDIPTAWYTIDDHDNTPARFWRYVAAALSRARAGLGDETLGAIDDWAIDGTDMVTVLLGELGDNGRPMALVLDDLHLISAPDILRQLEFFLERAPAWLQIVLSSRSVPPFPIARWRAQGLLSEARQDDLTLLPEEARQVLRAMTFVHLDLTTEQSVIELAAGWPAALQLAGLSLRDRDDADTFVREQLTGDRALFDFVVGEVLDRLPPSTRDAVLALSVLDDIDARRCAAVTGTPDGEALLLELAALGLPLVAVGADRRTYRFHHLFRALVRLELRIRDEQLIEVLHRRAAAAELEAGDHPAAVRHLLAVGDHDTAFQLVFDPVWDLYRTGSIHELGMWLDQFPQDFVGTDPGRIIRVATTLSLVGRLMEAEMWNERAAALEPADGTSPPDLVISRMLVHLGHGDTVAVRSEGTHYVDPQHLAPAIDDPDARFLSIMAIAALIDGFVDEAARWIEMIASTRLRPERLRAVGYPARHAWLAYEQGELDQADRRADLGLDGAGLEGRAAPHALVELYVTKAKVAAERLDIPSARRWADAAVELASATGSPLRPILHHHLAHEALLNVIEAEVGPDMALEALAAMSSAVMADGLADRYGLLTAELLGRSQRWDRCESVMEALPTTPRRLLVAARVAMGHHHLSTAMELLSTSDDSAWPLRVQVEAHLLRFRIQPDAVDHLRRAVELGAPRGLVWTFLREGAAVTSPLRAVLDTDPHWRTTPLARALDATSPAAASDEPPMVETLSARELEVLELLPTHLSTVELARRLYVSANTVRTHVKTIYRKLGVNSRSDAVRRATALGLLTAGEQSARR